MAPSIGCENISKIKSFLRQLFRSKGVLNMDTYIVDGVEVNATSHEEAFEKVFKGEVYRVVNKDDFYDIVVQGEHETKYFWVRSG